VGNNQKLRYLLLNFQQTLRLNNNIHTLTTKALKYWHHIIQSNSKLYIKSVHQCTLLFASLYKACCVLLQSLYAIYIYIYMCHVYCIVY